MNVLCGRRINTLVVVDFSTLFGTFVVFLCADVLLKNYSLTH